MVISKFRPEYWIRQGLAFLAILLFIGFQFNFSFNEGMLDIMSVSLWIAFIGGIILISYVLKFLFTGIRQIIVDDEKILVRYLISKRTNTIFYGDIKKFSVSREATTLNGVPLTDGYHNLQIELFDGDVLEFDEDEYSNFVEIRAEIYKNIS